MKHRKIVLAMGLALAISFTNQLQVNQAEAGFDLSGAVGGAINQQLNIDMDGMTNKQTSMLDNLMTAAVLLTSANTDITNAANMETAEAIDVKAVVGEMRANGLTADSFTQINDLTSSISDDKSAGKELSQKIMENSKTATPEVLATMTDQIHSAEIKRIAAGVYCALAVKDAGSIIKDAGMGLSGKAGDIDMDALQNLFQTAKNADSLCKMLGKKDKVVSTAMSEFKKQHHMADVSKEDALENTKDLVAQ